MATIDTVNGSYINHVFIRTQLFVIAVRGTPDDIPKDIQVSTNRNKVLSVPDKEEGEKDCEESTLNLAVEYVGVLRTCPHTPEFYNVFGLKYTVLWALAFI